MVIREHKKGCKCIEPTLAWGKCFLKKRIARKMHMENNILYAKMNF